jgi:rRNA-processing protein EBP2
VSISEESIARLIMAKGRRLKAALNAHKGVDHKVERQKQLQKQATKRKELKNANKNEEKLVDGHEEDEDMETGGVALATEDESEEEAPVGSITTHYALDLY